MVSVCQQTRFNLLLGRHGLVFLACSGLLRDMENIMYISLLADSLLLQTSNQDVNIELWGIFARVEDDA
jgi:hypothetical protein